MSLSIRKTITLNRSEHEAFQAWKDRFFDRADTLEAAEKNFSRALNRKYGSPACMLTGANDTFTLNLGFWVK